MSALRTASGRCESPTMRRRRGPSATAGGLPARTWAHGWVARFLPSVLSHEVLALAARTRTHADRVAPSSNSPSRPLPVDGRRLAGQVAGAGRSDLAGAPGPAPHARRGAVPRARQQPPGEDLSTRGAEVRAPGEHRPQQASAAVPRRRARRLAAAALRLHLPGGLLRHLPRDGADPFDRRQDHHRGPVHELRHRLRRSTAVAALRDQPRRQGDRARARDRPRGRARRAPEGRRAGPKRVLRSRGLAGRGRRAAGDGEDAHGSAAGHGAVRGAADRAARGRARGGRAPAQEPLRPAVRREPARDPARGPERPARPRARKLASASSRSRSSQRTR